MYIPTNGTDLPGDTEEERAFKLIGCHPAFPDDDTSGEMETGYGPDPYENDYQQGANYDAGRVSKEYFEYAWKLAGLLIGDRFWEDPDLVWSGQLGKVASRSWNNDQLVNIGSMGFNVPIWTYDGTEWVLPDTYNFYPATYAYNQPLWGWVDDYEDTAVAGHDELNIFMEYVFDIDSLVVEDVDGDGHFDVGDDYILFSVIDDGLFDKMTPWGTNYATNGTDTLFGGEFFSGETIFLYDGEDVTTFFDPGTAMFFGDTIDTVLFQTIWGYLGWYDLDALDIGILPEPSSIFLMLGSASGLAVLAGVLRRRVR